MNNIKWVGDDCTDGMFVPISNASYEEQEDKIIRHYEVKPIEEVAE